MKNRYQVSEAFKDSCKANVGLNRHGRIHIVEDNIDIVGENYDGQLVDFKIEDNCCANDTFIGTTVAKKITVNMLNSNNEINLENKEISASVGIQYIDDTTVNGEYIEIDSDKSIPASISIEGKSEQETRAGKNYLNVPKSFTFTQYKEIAVNIPAGQYKVTLASENHAGNDYPVIKFSKNNKVGYLHNKEINFSLDQDETSVGFYSNGYNYSESASIEATINELMISKDGGEYEEYGVMPSANFPSPIGNCGSFEITHCNSNLGNIDLLFKQMQAFNSNACREEIVENKKCVVFNSSGFRSASGFRGLTRRYKENTRYKVKFKVRIYDVNIKEGKALYANIYHTDGTYSNIAKNADGENWIDFEIISKENKTVDYIAFSYGSSAYWCINKDTFSIEEYIEGQEKDYVPNQEETIVFPIKEGQELCALKTDDKELSNYTDLNGQGWIADYLAETGIHKKTLKVKLAKETIWYSGFNCSIDEDSNYGAFVNVTFGIQEGKLMPDWKNLISNIGLCTIAKYNIGSETSKTEESSGFRVAENIVRIHIPKTSLGLTLHNTTAEIKQAINNYLDNYEVYLLLALKEEEIIPYTPEQQEAWDKLQNIRLYEGKNYFLSDNNLKPNITINYGKETVSFGNFIIQKPEDEEVKEITNFFGYDYMIKFNIPYVDTNTYPIRLDNYLENLCNQVGVSLGSKDIINADYMILGNPFTNGENCRTVLSNIAQLAGGFAKIGRDNRVYIVTLKPNDTIETLDGNNYYEDFSKNKQWGEVNSVVLSLSSIEGEKTERKDENSILKNGLTAITIENNYFLTNEEERDKVIDNLWSNLKGIKYIPFKTKYYGYPYLDAGDKINVLDNKDEEFSSYIFNHTFIFNGAFEGEITTNALTKVQTAYKNNSNINNRLRKTERIVNKIDGEIEDVIEEVDNQNQKISDVVQTVDEIRSHISEIADITISTDGNGSVYLTNINESEPVRLEIRPRGEDIAYLHPRTNLFPSNTLFMSNRKVRFATKDYSTEWEIPANLLWYDAENYDELILDYEGQSCVVNKKVGYNADGTKYLLSKPKTLTFKYPSIPLKAGDYTITVLGYSSAYLFVRLMCQNIYTDQFATKAEMHATVTQTAENITAEVAKKLTNYSTTVQMNSVIEQRANSILSKVSEIYATKSSLGNYSTTTQMNSAIEQKANSIKNEVSLTYLTKTSASDTYATKKSVTALLELKVNTKDLISEINASADRISLKTGRLVITAGNFQLDESGSIKAIGGTIGGFTLDSNKFTGNLEGIYNYSKYDASLALSLSMKTNIYPQIFYDIYDVDKDGKILAKDSLAILKHVNGEEKISKTIKGKVTINSKDPKNCILVEKDNEIAVSIGVGGINANMLSTSYIVCGDSNYTTRNSISMSGWNSTILLCSNNVVGTIITGTEIETEKLTCKTLNNESSLEKKKNIVKFEKKAIDLIKDSDIYEYNFKTEKDTDKKHIGFIIGKEYRTPKEVISKDGQAIEAYSQRSVLWKGVQEMIEIIENLQHRIAVLEGSEA